MGQVINAYELDSAMIEKEYQNGLVERYRRYVHSIAAKLVSTMHLPAEHLDEFISAGYLGLVEASKRYRPGQGTDFRNFAYLRIRGSIIDSIRASSDLSGRSYKMARAWAAAQSLEEAHSSADFREQKLSAEQTLAEIFEFAASGALAFKLSMDQVEEETAALVSDDLSQEDQIMERQKSSAIRSLIDMLPLKEKIIIRSYYFESKTFAQIERENEGMTKSWVSRLHARALRRLKNLILESAGESDVAC